MHNKIFTLCFIMLLPLSLFSQANVRVKRQQKAQHMVNLSYTPQWFPNAEKVQFKGHDNNVGQVLYPKPNMTGHNWGIEYQFTGKTGLILSLGMQTGIQNQKVGVLFNMGYVDETQPVYKKIIVDTSYGARISYYTFRAMGGYRWQSPFAFAPKWDMGFKTGVSFKYYRNVDYKFTKWGSVVLIDSTFIIRDAASQSLCFGAKSPIGRTLNYTGEFYFGVSRNIDLLFLQSFSLGIEATHAIWGGGTQVQEELYTVDNNGMPHNIATYDYHSQEFALGIRMTIGLGYKRR